MAESFKTNPFDLSNVIGASNSFSGYWVSVAANSSVTLSPAALFAIAWISIQDYNLTGSVNQSTSEYVLGIGCRLTIYGGYYMALDSSGTTISCTQYCSGAAFIVTSFGNS